MHDPGDEWTRSQSGSSSPRPLGVTPGRPLSYAARFLRGCELTAMEDVRLPADVEAAQRPTAPVGSRVRTTAQPGPSTSVRTIPGCGIPAPPRWRQWRGPAAAAAAPPRAPGSRPLAPPLGEGGGRLIRAILHAPC